MLGWVGLDRSRWWIQKRPSNPQDPRSVRQISYERVSLGHGWPNLSLSSHSGIIALHRGFREIFSNMDELGKPGAMTIEVESKTSAKRSDDERETIAVIGSGDFGRALAGRMVKAGGYNVVIGSRDVQKNWQENIDSQMFPREIKISMHT